MVRNSLLPATIADSPSTKKYPAVGVGSDEGKKVPSTPLPTLASTLKPEKTDISWPYVIHFTMLPSGEIPVPTSDRQFYRIHSS